MAAIDSILDDIKHKIGPSADYDYFDPDIIDAINATFAKLHQLGIGPKDGFSITDNVPVWSDFSKDPIVEKMARTYVYNSVRLYFDPPNNTSLCDMIKSQNDELEWRMQEQVDPQTCKEEDIAWDSKTI